MISNYAKLATSAPLTRTAALVTSGGAKISGRTWYEQRDDLRAAVDRLLLKQKHSTEPAEKQELGVRINDLNSQMHELKKSKPPTIQDLAHYFMDVARERLDGQAFWDMHDEARARVNAHEAQHRRLVR